MEQAIFIAHFSLFYVGGFAKPLFLGGLSRGCGFAGKC